MSWPTLAGAGERGGGGWRTGGKCMCSSLTLPDKALGVGSGGVRVRGGVGPEGASYTVPLTAILAGVPALGHS